MLLVLFMYIFAFPVFKNVMPIGSNFLIGIFLVGYYMFTPRYRVLVNQLFQKKYILKLFVLLFFVILYSFFIPSVLRTYDYSIISSFISQFITLSIGVLIFALYKMKESINLLPIHLIYIFFIQGCIQLISYLVPQINEFLNIFRTDGVISIGQNEYYDGARGLAISGQGFFGLGIGYAIIFVIIFKYWKKLTPSFPIFRYFILGILVFGGLSAARVSLVGIIIGVIYTIIENLFINKNKIFKFEKNLKLSMILSICVVMVLLLIFLLFLEYTSIKSTIALSLSGFTKYAFEFVEEFTQSGQLSTTSTDILFNRMYFQLDDWQTFLFGDGRYIEINGGYYMRTDAGYMRNILFFGFTGILLLFIYQLNFFDWSNVKYKFLNISILICILILHIKGEILGFSTMVLCILILFLQYQKTDLVALDRE